MTQRVAVEYQKVLGHISLKTWAKMRTHCSHFSIIQNVFCSLRIFFFFRIPRRTIKVHNQCGDEFFVPQDSIFSLIA